jgi:hypothetical protein
MRNPGATHRHPQRLAAAGVLLCALSAAACQNQEVSSQSDQSVSADTPAASANAAANHPTTVVPKENGTAMAISKNAFLDDAGALAVEAGDLSFLLKTGGCREEGETVKLCDAGVELTVVGPTSAKQVLRPDDVYVDSAATLYRGPLDASYKQNGHTFVVTDVNGDSAEDLLVWTGKEGNYGGPSYDVYLFDPTGKEWVFSQEFTDLIPGTNGLFQVEHGKIKTASTEGCCFHAFDTYEVRGGKPVLVERVTEDANDPKAPVTRTERLINGEMREVKSP